MTSAAGGKPRRGAQGPAVPVDVIRNLLGRYLDRNREFYTAEFLEEARGA